MRAIVHVGWLGWNELIALSRQPALCVFIVYGLTLFVLTAGEGVVLEVRRAPVAFVDEDRSRLSRAIGEAFRPPHFQPAQSVSLRQVPELLDRRSHTFVVHVPSGFERELLTSRRPQIRVDVDATAVSQAFLGASYVEAVVTREARERVAELPGAPPAADARVHVRFNPNRDDRWYSGVLELLFMITLLSAVLPAAALLRERENGTIEHLLAMPVRPIELMLGKVWPYALVVACVSTGSFLVVIQGVLDTPMRGSYGLLLLGTLVYLFTTAGLGMLLATLARTVGQVGLLSLLVLTPMMFLSGVWTPIESMPELLRWITHLMPIRYYAEFCYAVILRGATLDVLAFELVMLVAIGTLLFNLGAWRFRARFGVPGG